MPVIVSLFVLLDVVGMIALVIVVMRRKQHAHESGPQREQRGLSAVAQFQRIEVVHRKIASMFPKTEQNEVASLLHSDLPATFGFERLQLALLKLSGGNLGELRHLVETVTSDEGRAKAKYADVIGEAEWPEANRMGEDYVRLLPEEQEPISRRDLRQYLRWVKR
jgi:hypothetical protein